MKDLPPCNPNDQLCGNIILLHDGGGDRRETVRALPMIIEGLRARGYEIVPVYELLGKTRADVMPPIPANATNTLSLWVGTAVSGGAYRRHLNLPPRVLLPLVSMGLLGGLAGALLLIKTPAHTFLRLIPWLMLAATLLFTFGRYLTGRLSADISHQASNAAMAGASFFEFLVAIYGGYFGGGIGIMNLAMFAALGMTDIHEMSAENCFGGSNQWSGGGHLHRHRLNRLAAGTGDDRGSRLGWVCLGSSRAEIAAVASSRDDHYPRSGNDNLFFPEGLPLVQGFERQSADRCIQQLNRVHHRNSVIDFAQRCSQLQNATRIARGHYLGL